ncbi:MAG: DNA mismatch repair endonuclease MutL [Treponema sp.]|jgi:DNA mismatch repair protein MutL|nr:DNA mismatch repair endonuclease MutL [Treponema sp.]
MIAAVEQGTRRIAVLPPEEARKIAAGEVVDRPAALVREFLDNAIDSGAGQIDVFIDEGGCRRVEVCDDGEGMDRENLELCTLTHATSKIRRLDDLARMETLGFRGEALAAASAVAALEILSSVDGREAWRLLAGPGSRPPLVEPGRRNRGTSIRALGLFDTIPARKRFLKRDSSETLFCRQAFIDKALAFPEIEFRFSQEGSLKLAFPGGKSLKERFTAFLVDNSARNAVPPGGFLHEIHALGEGFRLTIIVGGPELYRNDRRQQFIFANRRRILDYSLLQALEYGVQGWFPNAAHPVGAVYIEIDPALADFNIHPAKREARFADPGAIHHAISTALRNFSRNTPAAVPVDRPLFPQTPSGPPRPGNAAAFPRNYGGERAPGYTARLAMEALLDEHPDFTPLPGRQNPDGKGGNVSAEKTPGADNMAAEAAPPYGTERLHFIGRIFELFLLVERGDRLFIIDQHAAHERILYDRLLSTPIVKQELLVPIRFESGSPGEDLFLTAKRGELEKLGVLIEEIETGRWQITALPEAWRLSDRETLEALRELQNAGENMAERWAATLSCRRAVKDGDYLDDISARSLAEAALALPVPRCPHGRPLWVEISRADLYRGVRRA